MRSVDTRSLDTRFADTLSEVAIAQAPLERLVAWQTFEGYWAWTEGLFGVLGVKGDAVKAAFAGQPSVAPNVMATAAVVAYMRNHLTAARDEWEMLAEKALWWIDSQAVGMGAESVVAAVTNLL